MQGSRRVAYDVHRARGWWESAAVRQCVGQLSGVIPPISESLAESLNAMAVQAH